jgi:glycosyltransferase involved in cell wall biosynthesis
VKIAIIAPLVTAIREPQRGGSQSFVADLAPGLGSRGHEVHVYVASGSDIPGVRLIDTGIDPRSLAATLYRAGGSSSDSRTAESAFANVYKRVREISYDVVHNHAFDAPAITLAGTVGRPVVHTLHLPPDKKIATALHQAAHHPIPPTVATVSASQAEAWRVVTDVDAILKPYVPTVQIPWSAAAGDGVVFAGRLSPEKGVAEAIDIARMAGMRIDVYGDPYDGGYAREQIDPRSVGPDVEVHSSVPRSRLWRIMGRAAVVLSPARWEEPFGMVAAEAQACGTPVVAYRRGGLAEVIVDGLTGFLVMPDDIPAAAAALHKVVEISRLQCRNHAETNLDLAKSLDAHEQLYRRLIAATVPVTVDG